VRYDLRRRQFKVGVVCGVQPFVHGRLIRWYKSTYHYILVALLTVNVELVLATILTEEVQWLVPTTS
jgi:hypothetical protein